MPPKRVAKKKKKKQPAVAAIVNQQEAAALAIQKMYRILQERKREEAIKEIEVTTKSAHLIQALWWLRQHRARVHKIHLDLRIRWYNITAVLIAVRRLISRTRKNRQDNSAVTIQLCYRRHRASVIIESIRMNAIEQDLASRNETTTRRSHLTTEETERKELRLLWQSCPAYHHCRDHFHSIAVQRASAAVLADSEQISLLPTAPPLPRAKEPLGPFCAPQSMVSSGHLKYWTELLRMWGGGRHVENLLLQEVHQRARVVKECKGELAWLWVESVPGERVSLMNVHSVVERKGRMGGEAIRPTKPERGNGDGGGGGDCTSFRRYISSGNSAKQPVLSLTG